MEAAHAQPDATTGRPSTPDLHDADIENELDAIIADSDLGIRAVNQDAFEREVAAQADRKVFENADEDDKRRLDKAEVELGKLQLMLEHARERRDKNRTSIAEKQKLIDDINHLQQTVAHYKGDIRDIRSRMKERAEALKALSTKAVDGDVQLPHETERDFLIRTGKITPFDKVPGLEKQSSIVAPDVTLGALAGSQISGTKPLSAQNLRRPGFDQDQTFVKSAPVKESAPVKVEDESSDLSSPPESSDEEGEITTKPSGKKRSRGDSESEYEPETASKRTGTHKAAKVQPELESSESSDDDWHVGGDIAKKPKKSKAKAKAQLTSDGAPITRLDDGDERLYQKRLGDWAESRQRTRENAGMQHDNIGQDLEEWHMPHPTTADKVFDGNLRLPGDIHPSLFDYQNVGVKWLWELHCQNSGGVLGDEMGLGKTVQVIAFVAGLHYSGMLDKPVLVVAPGAVLKQWATEFHDWWPALRVAILHKSGSGMLTTKSSDDVDGIISDDESDEDPRSRGSRSAAQKIVERVFEKGHILITTYEGLTTYGDVLVDREWGYVVLDEGHKIRNPDTKVALNCKSLRTVHRIILSGTPIQNNLTELWSLFDFILPGRLGDLPTFREQFEAPIRSGGFKNANNTEVLTASTCAKVLREMIGPYLLRRLKLHVLKDLPGKEEQIIRCKLTKSQEVKYLEYLDSPEVHDIRSGKMNSLGGISTLRKICNHPDLANREELQRTPGYRYGDPKHSGKMQIVKKLLVVWKTHGNRVLLFSQSRQVLDILERDIQEFKYLRMDGMTPISQRQDLVNQFNADISIDIFLVTTRVGGLGLNLTGADRVVIFDPDWNPSTDLQARERAWRIGQTKPVKIYRLVSANTIEEKMYSRQVYKHHLSQKILTDSEQRRIFEAETVHDLFTYGTSTSATSDLFRAAEMTYSPRPIDAVESSEASDIQNINGVAGLTEYHGLVPSNDPDNPGPYDKARGEQYFMNEIFSAGVESTLEHDAIIGEKRLSSNQSSAANQFAAKVARDAERKLRESIRITQEAAIGTVTWTGRSGTVGKPQERPKKSASSLLAGLKNKGKKTMDRRSLKEQMFEAFKKSGDVMTTEQIMAWSRERGIDKRAPEKAAEMKKALREMASMEKESHTWSLKKKFQ